MKLALFTLLALLTLASVSAQKQTESQESAAGAEFDALMSSHAKPYSQSIKADERAFRLAALPYGPLSIQVGKARGRKDNRYWEVNYIFALDAASDLDVLAISNSFFCGQDCEKQRVAEAKKKLPQISELVREFHDTAELNLISFWGVRDEYRVNNVFRIQGQTNEALPSPVMGFVPSGKWRRLKDIEQYLSEVKLSKTKLDSMLARIQELGIVAVVRNEEGYIKVVHSGIGYNEEGLIFHQNFFKKTITGPMVISRRFNYEFHTLYVVGAGVIYYEKSASLGSPDHASK